LLSKWTLGSVIAIYIYKIINLVDMSLGYSFVHNYIPYLNKYLRRHSNKDSKWFKIEISPNINFLKLAILESNMTAINTYDLFNLPSITEFN
jgi:hypothetical protein